jgi:RNA polymerase sigma-70 factor (ECF subfamily)
MEQRRKTEFIASIVASHGRQLMKFFVARLPDAAEAKDLAQEVYLRLLRLDRPDFIRCPEAYLFTVAANIVREHALKRSKRPVHVTLADEQGSDEELDEVFIVGGPEDTAVRDAGVQQLLDSLARLSPKARAAFIWHRRDGCTYDEIAARLGVSRNMVKKYLSQALAHCRRDMQERQEGRS